jgi:hypothetical protein
MTLELGDAGEFGEFSVEEVREIAAFIGQMIIRLPLMARQAGHKDPLDSFRDYVQIADDDMPVERAAKEFMHDMVDQKPRMSVKELIAKWYPDAVLRLL